MELLINSVGFFAVVLAVIGFYGGLAFFAWRGIQQYRADANRGGRQRQDGSGRLLFDIKEATK